MVAREGHTKTKMWWGARGQFSRYGLIDPRSRELIHSDVFGSCEDFPCLNSSSPYPPRETALPFCEALVILPGLGCNRTAVLEEARTRSSQPFDAKERYESFDCIRHCPALWSPLTVGIPSRTVPFLQSAIEIPAFQIQVLNPARDAYLSPTIVATREWDPPKAAAFATIFGRPQPQDGCWFIDVGANVGFFSLLAAALGCHVVAIEPQREPFELLSSSVLANAYDGLIHPKNLLLSACGKTDSFKLEKMSLEGRQHFAGASYAVHAEAGCTDCVRSTCLDELLLELPTGTTVRLLKLDAEGAEASILLGALGSISRLNIEAIVLEYYPLTASRREHLRLLPSVLESVMRIGSYELFSESARDFRVVDSSMLQGFDGSVRDAHELWLVKDPSIIEPIAQAVRTVKARSVNSKLQQASCSAIAPFDDVPFSTGWTARSTVRSECPTDECRVLGDRNCSGNDVLLIPSSRLISAPFSPWCYACCNLNYFQCLAQLYTTQLPGIEGANQQLLPVAYPVPSLQFYQYASLLTWFAWKSAVQRYRLGYPDPQGQHARWTDAGLQAMHEVKLEDFEVAWRTAGWPWGVLWFDDIPVGPSFFELIADSHQWWMAHGDLLEVDGDV